MAFNTERRVAFVQQSLINRAVRCVADGASLTHRLMLIDKWAALLRMTLEARFVSAEEGKSASFKPLLDVCWSALDRDPFVRFMAIAAAHLAFEHGMVMRQ